MNSIWADLLTILPECFVLSMTLLVLLAGLISTRKKFVYLLTQLTLIGALVITADRYIHAPTLSFAGHFVSDKMASLLDIFIFITSFFAFVYSRSYIKLRNIPQLEYYTLGLFSILGMMVMVSGHSLLVLFLGLELLSLPLYAMVAIQRDASLGSEAAVKFFVTGSLASAMLLYGFSLIYGATGSLDINNIAQIIAHNTHESRMILTFGLVFVLAGLAFKFGAAPFHMWVPDVYHGAPSSVTLFLASAPKIAVLGMTLRIFATALPSLLAETQQLIIVLAIVSMAIGNIVAIAQSNIKRMLAYSSIAHIGYMLLGIIAGTAEGYAAAAFYIITYAIMTVCAFGMIVLLSKAGFEGEEIQDLQGLNARNPWFAFMMLLAMFSMAGIPPIVGFFAKLGVLQALVNVHLVWLAAIALVFAIIGAYYYLRIVKVMYFEEPTDATPLVEPLDLRMAMSINGVAILLLGLFPSTIITLCREAFLLA